MLSNHNAGERTLGEFVQLLSQTGWKVVEVHAAHQSWMPQIVAVPVAIPPMAIQHLLLGSRSPQFPCAESEMPCYVWPPEASSHRLWEGYGGGHSRSMLRLGRSWFGPAAEVPFR